MPLEAGSKLADLNDLWPLDSPDPVAQGAAHLRLIKAIVKADAVDAASLAAIQAIVDGHTTDIATNAAGVSANADAIAALPSLPYFEESHSGSGAPSYRIQGETLECWGRVTADQNVGATITFPKVFVTAPSVQVTSIFAAGRFAVVESVTATSVLVFNYENAGAARPGDVSWYAVGRWNGVA